MTRLARNAPALLAFAGFVAVVVGLWWERPSLALIVPGGAVFAIVSRTYLRGGYEPPRAPVKATEE